MARKVLAVILVIALAIGTTGIVSASSKETGGDIEFKAGGTEIIPPTESEEDLGGDLWFGIHDLSVISDDVGNPPSGWGRTGGFNSRMNANVVGTPTGQYTGIEVLSGDTNVNIAVDVTGFFVGSKETIKGFKLELIPRKLETVSPAVTGAQPAGVILEAAGNGQRGDDVLVLRCDHAAQYLATWYGNLVVLPGSAIEKGVAQAVLTWTVQNT